MYQFVNNPAYVQTESLQRSVNNEIAETLNSINKKTVFFNENLEVLIALNNLVVNSIYQARPVNIPDYNYRQHQFDTIEGVAKSLHGGYIDNMHSSCMSFVPNYYSVNFEYSYPHPYTAGCANISGCTYDININISPTYENFIKFENVIFDNCERIMRSIRDRMFPGQPWNASSNPGYSGANIMYSKLLSSEDVQNLVVHQKDRFRDNIVSAKIYVSLVLPGGKNDEKASCGVKRIVKTEERVVYQFECGE